MNTSRRTKSPGLGRAKARWWHVLLVLTVIGGAAYVAWYWLHDERAERKRVTEDIRAQILEGRDMVALAAFDVRADRQKIAEELVDDPDPKVRAYSVQLLIRGETVPRNPPMELPDARIPFDRDDDQAAGMRIPGLNRLIRDEDAQVRLAAIRAAGQIVRTEFFSTELLQTLWAGQEIERLLVAEDLGHWSGAECRRVFLSHEQPANVRLAALRSAVKWRSRQFIGNQFGDAMMQVVRDPHSQIRLEAVEATRWVPAVDVVPVWLYAASGKYPDSAQRAVEVWIDELVNNDDPDGWSGVRTAHTRDLFRSIPGRPGHPPPEVVALAGYVLGRAAVGHSAILDRIPNERPEWRVKNIAYPLIHIPQELADYYAGDHPTTFTAWLPHENAVGDPHRRELAAYLLEQMKEPAQWIEKERDRWLPPEIEPE